VICVPVRSVTDGLQYPLIYFNVILILTLNLILILILILILNLFPFLD
jgi:hypothetical protein